MAITLREKELKNGQISYYLDIYHNKIRWYEFLNIRIQKDRPSPDDKEKKRMALEIKTRRENELIVEENDLTDKQKRHGCFVDYFERYKNSKGYNSMYTGTCAKLKKYANGNPVPFLRVTEDWLMDLQKYFLSQVSHNTAARYMRVINGALKEAVRQKVIKANPYANLTSRQKLKLEDIFRNSFTIEELQLLSDTTCKIDKQIKQGYLFSAFTGLRWSDVNPLRWSDISIRRSEGVEYYQLQLKQEKTKGIGYLPLSEMAIEILKERQEEAKQEEKSLFVFSRLKEDERSAKKVYQRVEIAMKKWAKAAGIDPARMHFHSARHSFATNVLENSEDGDIYTVSKLLGHKSIVSTQVYAHVRDKRKLSAVQGLPRIKIDGASRAAG